MTLGGLGSGGKKLEMICWPFSTITTASPTSTTMATIPAKIDPDDGLVPGQLDMNVLDSNDGPRPARERAVGGQCPAVRAAIRLGPNRRP